MKIISKPDTSSWSTKHTCSNCDSNLEINGEDLIYELEDTGYYDMESDAYYVDCPVCSELSYVQENEIPKLVRMEAKNRADEDDGDDDLTEDAIGEMQYELASQKTWFDKLLDFLGFV